MKKSEKELLKSLFAKAQMYSDQLRGIHNAAYIQFENFANEINQAISQSQKIENENVINISALKSQLVKVCEGGGIRFQELSFRWEGDEILFGFDVSRKFKSNEKYSNMTEQFVRLKYDSCVPALRLWIETHNAKWEAMGVEPEEVIVEKTEEVKS